MGNVKCNVVPNMKIVGNVLMRFHLVNAPNANKDTS